MHCNAVVDKEQFDEIVTAYMEQGKQLIALQNLYDSVTNERDSWKNAYSRVKDTYDEEVVKHRKEKENMNNSLRDKRERVFDLTVENEKLRLEMDTLARINSSVCDERDKYREQIKRLNSQLEGARETSKHYAEQAARYQNERDKALEDATRHHEDYAKLTDKYAKLEKLKDEFCIEACNLSSALRARNALLQIMFLATGLNECMLKEMFNCRFCTPDASFDADLTRRMILHCISNNSTIIDTLTGYRFDIADRLEKAIEVRDIYGMPKKQGQCSATPKCSEDEKAQRPANSKRWNKGKKKTMRAKPEQSE